MSPDRTSFREFDAPAALAPHVAGLWRRDGPPDGSSAARVLPDGCVDIVWGLEGSSVTAMVAGPDTEAHLSRLTPATTLVGMRFWPGAAASILDVPFAELRDRRVPLAELWGRPAIELAERVAEAPRPELALASAVQARLPDRRDAATRAIAQALVLTAGPGAVARVADQLGYSPRQLQRRCLVAFGYGPKTLQQVLRFQRALRMARSGVGLAHVAAATGYADQPHLARETRRLAGVPLSALI